MDSEALDDEEKNNTDLEEIEEMLYCSIYHEHRTSEDDGDGITKQEDGIITSGAESKSNVLNRESNKKHSHGSETKECSKETSPIVLSSDDKEEIECLGRFSKENWRNKKSASKSDIFGDKTLDQSTGIVAMNPKRREISEVADRSNNNKTESAGLNSDVEDGEITGDSDDGSVEVEIIAEEHRKNELEEGEVDSDEIEETAVRLETKDSDRAPLSDTENIKANFTINVDDSFRPIYEVSSLKGGWSDYDTESSLSDSEAYTATCPYLTSLPAALDEGIQKDLCHSDSEISDDFSVSAIQETMPDCCWQISEEDRYPERRLILDDLINCNICGLTGHRKYDCPELLQPSSCHYCGRRGHRTPTSLAHCPNAVCVLCWAPGHIQQHCPSQWIKKNVCDLCNNTGHTGMQCPHWWNGYYDQDEDDLIEKATRKDQKKLFCCNCGEEGHCYEECNLPRPTYNDYSPFTGDSSDSEDEVRIVNSPEVGDFSVWSLNICPTDEKEDENPSNTTILTFRDFLKIESKSRFSDGEIKRKTKKRAKTFKNMLKEARLRRKRQKKYRKERKKLELIYGKVGKGNGSNSDVQHEQRGNEKRKVRKKKRRAPVEREKWDASQKASRRHGKKWDASQKASRRHGENWDASQKASRRHGEKWDASQKTSRRHGEKCDASQKASRRHHRKRKRSLSEALAHKSRCSRPSLSP